jgi:lysozyme family protein
VSLFPACFAVVVGNEGGYTDNAADPGNWTGGAVGVGKLAGTKYGVSAASFPGLDIAALTIDQARTIYRQRYWVPTACEHLPPMVALMVFDSAVNNGVNRAARLLQDTVGVPRDGLIGPETLSRVSGLSGLEVEQVAAGFLARRIVFMAGLSLWSRFGFGWALRLATLPFAAQGLTASGASIRL